MPPTDDDDELHASIQDFRARRSSAYASAVAGSISCIFSRPAATFFAKSNIFCPAARLNSRSFSFAFEEFEEPFGVFRCSGVELRFRPCLFSAPAFDSADCRADCCPDGLFLSDAEAEADEEALLVPPSRGPSLNE